MDRKKGGEKGHDLCDPAASMKVIGKGIPDGTDFLFHAAIMDRDARLKRFIGGSYFVRTRDKIADLLEFDAIYGGELDSKHTRILERDFFFFEVLGSKRGNSDEIVNEIDYNFFGYRPRLRIINF